MTFYLRLFGTFELLKDGQPVRKFRSEKVRALLTFLTMESSRTHRRSSVAAMLWSQSTGRSSLRNLRTSLSNLRECLEDEESIIATRQDVQIVPTELYKVDVLEFERLLTECEMHQHEDASQCTDCLARYQQAVDLYKGEFLTGMSLIAGDGFSEWQTIQREALHNQMQHALQILVAHDAQDEDPQRVRRNANRLLSLSPWSEVAYRALMESFARSGDRSGAMMQYEQCEKILYEELGADPEPETLQLAEKIRSGDTAKKVAQPRQIKKQANDHNLPRLLSPLFGRKAEIDKLNRLLTDDRYPLVSLVGSGGMGKTSLSILAGQQAVTHFDDGVWFVPLDSVKADASESELVHSITTALKLSIADDDMLTQQLVQSLQLKQQLLIFDNCEQLVENDCFMGLVQQLLSECRQLRLLMTSRQPLNLQMEYVVRLGGLSLPDSAESDPLKHSSIQLFIERAERTVPQFVYTDETLPQIVQLCQLLDGMPLAIELAVTGLRQQSLDTVLLQLTHDIDSLATTMRDVPKRHRTMRAVFDYSWQLLTPEEQKALMQLSLFRSGFSELACDTVAQADATLLAKLTSKSLLHYSQLNSRQRRLYLLETVRQFAAEQALQSLDPATIAGSRERHANYYMRLIGSQVGELRGAGQQAALALVGLEIDNLRQAWVLSVERQQVDALLAAVDAVHHFYDMRSWYEEGATLMAQAVGVAAGNSSENAQLLSGKALAREGWFRFQLGEHSAGRAKLQAGLAALEDGGFSAETTFCHNYLSAVAMHLNDLEEAMERAAHALQLAQSHDDQHGEMIAHNLLGRIHFLGGNLSSAEHNYSTGLTLAQQNGNRWSSAFSLDYLGQLASHVGELDDARRLFARSLAIRQHMHDNRGIGLCYRALGDVAEKQGDIENAAQLYQRALTIFTTIGHSLNVAQTQEKIELLDVMQLLNMS